MLRNRMRNKRQWVQSAVAHSAGRHVVPQREEILFICTDFHTADFVNSCQQTVCRRFLYSWLELVNNDDVILVNEYEDNDVFIVGVHSYRRTLRAWCCNVDAILENCTYLHLESIAMSIDAIPQVGQTTVSLIRTNDWTVNTSMEIQRCIRNLHSRSSRITL